MRFFRKENNYFENERDLKLENHQKVNMEENTYYKQQTWKT